MLSDRVSEPVTSAAQAAEIVSYRGGSLLVLGGAGSGKTRLLRDRFLWLLKHGVGIHEIALLVPSRARVEAAQTALERELDGLRPELVVGTAADLAVEVLRRRVGVWQQLAVPTLDRSERLAMLVERGDELELEQHDFAGNRTALLEALVRRIDRLKSELIDAESFAAWAQNQPDPREREFAALFGAHERMLRELGARDENDAVRAATALLATPPPAAPALPCFGQVLVDDAQELCLAEAALARTLAPGALSVAGDPHAAARRFRGAGAARLEWFRDPDTRVVSLPGTWRCPPAVWEVASAVSEATVSLADGALRGGGADTAVVESTDSDNVRFWRCDGERAQARTVATEVQRLLNDERIAPDEILVLVPDVVREGQAVAAALSERAVTHRLIGDRSFYQRAEIRDLLAWLRLLTDPGDALAVVRALARPPIDLHSLDIARCTQIARRRKLDMVSALAAATQSPQVPPEARERIGLFLRLQQAGVVGLDTMRPDLYVHQLIERLGLRNQHLFAASADVVARMRALTRFEQLAASQTLRLPQSTAREFAVSVCALARLGASEQEEPTGNGGGGVQVLAIEQAGGLEASHVFVLGCSDALIAAPSLDSEPVPDELLSERLPADGPDTRRARLRQRLYVAVTRTRERLVLCYAADGGARPLGEIERAREHLGASWQERSEDQLAPRETLQATYRKLRDELLDGTSRTAGRLAELRLDTDLDISHAVVRYLELLKVAALIARNESDPGHGVADALPDINARIGQAVTAEQREILSSSPLDDRLLDMRVGARRVSPAASAREEPSLERFLPIRDGGVILSATDIETYRACPLRYKFARVFRIPREPTLHQRFGIVMHQVLERYHAETDGEPGPLAGLLFLLDGSWRRAGLGDSDEERQLYRKAIGALRRYHERYLREQATPVWFERPFSFRLGRHLVRGRVDRVDRLPSGEHELIDYKTGRPKSAAALAADVQLSLYALAAREAWGLEATRGAYHYLLDDEKLAVAADAQRVQWIAGVATDVAEGIRAQEFEPTPSPRVCRICDYRLLCPAAEH